jgi:hypothetical protein
MSSRLQRGSLCSIVPKFLHDAVASVPGGGGGSRWWRRRRPFFQTFCPVPGVLFSRSSWTLHHNDLVSTSTAQLAVPFPSFTSTLPDLASPRLILSASIPSAQRTVIVRPPTLHHRLSAQRFLIDPRALRERERERERDLCRGTCTPRTVANVTSLRDSPMGQNARVASRQARVIRHSALFYPVGSRPVWTYLCQPRVFLEFWCLPVPNDLVSACTPCPRPIRPSFHCQYTPRVYCASNIMSLQGPSSLLIPHHMPSPPHLTFATRCVATSRCIVTLAAYCQCLSTPQKALCQGLEEKNCACTLRLAPRPTEQAPVTQRRLR